MNEKGEADQAKNEDFLINNIDLGTHSREQSVTDVPLKNEPSSNKGKRTSPFKSSESLFPKTPRSNIQAQRSQ